MATVELSNLRKTFGAYTALEDLNLAIGDGEFLVLLGPSGSGTGVVGVEFSAQAAVAEALAGDDAAVVASNGAWIVMQDYK